ncbi:Nramp family divalent metal transporter [Virgibacillus necropolis]|uniref:Iron transporter n=1 Tax=Virgibacillus necropolis TaxID=163877 RepID=A0A221M939_9BACI|nr:Nramp family divalent metal transporter [Virgibacillus necropolis]ASN04142.1 iron transporter [Virgibacillus necropolis]
MGEKKYDIESTSTALPNKGKKKLFVIGPGIVLAATGIGAGDLVTSIVAGAEFGMALVWAVIIGAFLKFAVTEGVGRWTLATGQTIIEGWRSLGKWTMGYFFVYVSLFGLIYGAAIATACGLMMYTMFPIMPVWAWAILHSVLGFTLIWFSRYRVFERIIVVLIGIMVIGVLGSAIMLLPNLSTIPLEAFVPSVPDGSVSRIFAIIGGLGGTMALAAYGYWVRAKGWRDKSMVPTMRLDASIAYIVTGIFCISMMLISSQFLYGSGLSFAGVEGMQEFLNLYGEKFGSSAQLVLNIGFWAATFTSLLGSWNGIPYLFADFVRVLKQKNANKSKESNLISEKDPAYRAFLAWLTFPSMLLLLFKQPVAIILLYGVLGSLFLPFLAVTLLILLNSKQIAPEYRNRFGHNSILVFIFLLFISLGVISFL